MSKRKEIIRIKTQKPRNFELIELQIKGLMRTRVIRNKKKDIKKFNWKKDFIELKQSAFFVLILVCSL